MGIDAAPEGGPQQTDTRTCGIRETPWVSCSSPLPRGEGYALRAGQPRAVDPMGGELAEDAPPGWGRMAPRAGTGCCGERGSQGSWRRCWGRTSDFVLARAPAAGCAGIGKGLARGMGASVGQAATGSLGCPPPTRSAAASHCLEPPAAAGAETERESRAASSWLPAPLAQSPARPSPPRPSSWPYPPPLGCFAG